MGRKTTIHQSSCNQDLSCLKGDCPSFATVESATATPQKKRPARRLPFPAELLLPEPTPIVPPEQFSVCLTGIGGTGVVTVNQVLGTAAFRSGLRVQTYDHTGASQKAGPVVSHLKVMAEGVDGAPTVGTASADLYLVFDPLVGVGANNIALASPQRTVAIVSTTQVPTGEMVANKDKKYPAFDQLRHTIDGQTRADSSLFIDAQGLAETLMGDHMASNLLLVGAAYQAGALPIPAAAIEDAIRLNGTAVEMNVQAFRWGRLYVADRARVDAVVAAASASGSAVIALLTRPALSNAAAELVARVGATGELKRVLELRVPELIAFQNLAYAARYVDHVATVRRAEQSVAGERSELSVAVAKNLYKLMAPKDEYEVARLLLDDTELARLKANFGEQARVKWHLHPTFLRKLGVRHRVALGGWFTPVLKLLRWAKWMRGTPLDLLGRTRVRRLEQALVPHYLALVHGVLAQLKPANHAAAVQLAALPDMVRGYEDVKERNVVQYLAAARAQATALDVAWPAGAEFSALPVTPAVTPLPTPAPPALQQAA